MFGLGRFGVLEVFSWNRTSSSRIGIVQFKYGGNDFGYRLHLEKLGAKKIGKPDILVLQAFRRQNKKFIKNDSNRFVQITYHTGLILRNKLMLNIELNYEM